MAPQRWAQCSLLVCLSPASDQVTQDLFGKVGGSITCATCRSSAPTCGSPRGRWTELRMQIQEVLDLAIEAMEYRKSELEPLARSYRLYGQTLALRRKEAREAADLYSKLDT